MKKEVVNVLSKFKGDANIDSVQEEMAETLRKILLANLPLEPEVTDCRVDSRDPNKILCTIRFPTQPKGE